MDYGTIKVEIANCDLCDIIKRACDRQSEIATSHSIEYDLDDLPEIIGGDAAAIDQIITNLLSNAVKGAPDILVTGSRDGSDAIIAVKDHDVGIDEEDLASMFKRFFRAKTSEGIAGNGIGLNLIRHLAEQHGGTITVESVKGEGSVFTVRLPVDGPQDSDEGLASFSMAQSR